MSKSKSDLHNQDDIKLLVNTFYDAVKKDSLLAPIFHTKIPGDWQPHLDIMYQFWNSVLFGTKEYSGNPFLKHMYLPLKQEHFEKWIELFYKTIEDNFEGRVADEAKRRAMIIAHTFYNRMNLSQQSSPLPKI